MALTFNQLLQDAGIQPRDVRLLRHQDTRVRSARSVFTLWLDERTEFERYQSWQRRDQGKKFAAPFWASFVVDPTGSTFFAGLYRVLSRRDADPSYRNPLTDEPISAPGDLYELIPADALAEFIGRLHIDWGDGMKAWVQRADYQDKPIIELRRHFSEPPFPGPLEFIEPLSRIPVLPHSWREALRTRCGVYLLTCPLTGQLYVGSATGEDGFLGRWLEYERNGHGGNVLLKERARSDYQVSILEVARTSDSREDIIALEMRWMRKLNSRQIGLNA